mgnify:CR=1 FL=1
MPKTIVVALGGNAILQESDVGTVQEQFQNIERACEHLIPIIRDGHRLIITHGNGPQVGNLLIQQEASQSIVPALPLDACVAMTQGQIGSMIQQALTNCLVSAGIQREVVTMVTHFSVDSTDPDFQEFSKPVGPFFDAETKAQHLANGHIVKEIRPGNDKPYRRTVPSPLPLRLLERNALKLLTESGSIVIAAGGGGIPLLRLDDDTFRTIEAVIDKDRAGEKLAESVIADIYMILTDVSAVSINYGTDKQEELSVVTASEGKRHFENGQFASGSMGPKVMSCLEFIEFGGDEAIIAGLESAADALAGLSGTHFVSDK